VLKAVIFDVDGTLVDSVDLHAKGWQDAFAEFGYAIEYLKIRSQIGKGGDQLLPVFLSQADMATKAEAIEKRRSEIFKTRYLPKVVGFPNVRQLFRRLQMDGVKTLLASSAKGDELGFYKRRAGIEDLVDEETSSEDADKSKPHPDIFEAALARMPGIRPKDILVVGDSPYDAEAAAKAGLRTIGVLCGGFSEEDLRAAGCVYVLRDPSDLLSRYHEGSLMNA
jgi:phosphoglycolate phosphatase-like HAD superfamily hydrolase